LSRRAAGRGSVCQHWDNDEKVAASRGYVSALKLTHHFHSPAQVFVFEHLLDLKLCFKPALSL
jgi:hypothetical protein